LKNSTLVLLFLVCFANSAFSQKEVHHIVGKTIQLLSDILNEEREIQIYLPEDYQVSNEKCPVIYVFDSQKYFLNAVAYQQNLRFQEETPGFIVVGIKTKDNERRKLYNSESSIFSDYLEKELLPYIDNTYRTLRSERVFFGWQRAAAFGVEVLASKPDLFKGYFLASPTFLSPERVSNVGKMLDKNTFLDNYLYFTLGDVEAWSIDDTDSLSELLKNKASNKLKWEYDLFDNENHYSTTIVTMNKGLKYFFKDYPPIRYYSLAAFNESGGIEGLKERFKQRGERYQISTEVHNNSKRYLFLLAVRENDFLVFTELEKEFPNFLTSFSRDNMFERFGQFYVKHKAYKKAVEYFKIGLQKFPKSDLLYTSLGDLYKAQGNEKKAKKAYKKTSTIN
jgi:predicted alpha/beta superfamily hydrolase